MSTLLVMHLTYRFKNPLTDSPRWSYPYSWHYMFKSFNGQLQNHLIFLFPLQSPCKSCLEQDSFPFLLVLSVIYPLREWVWQLLSWGLFLMWGEGEATVAVGTWFVHIHSPLLDYFWSKQPNNYALDSDNNQWLPMPFILQTESWGWDSTISTIRPKAIPGVSVLHALPCILVGQLLFTIHGSSTVIDWFRNRQS